MASKPTGRQSTTKTSTRRAAPHKSAAQRFREAQGVAVDLPVVGKVHIPPLDDLAYYAGLSVLAATEVIDWPVALVLAAGHALTYSRHRRVLAELGEALDEGRAGQGFAEALDESDVGEELGEALADPPA